MRVIAVMTIVITSLLSTAIVGAAEWKEPKTGKLNEGQMTRFVGIAKDAAQEIKSKGRSLDNATSPIESARNAISSTPKREQLMRKYRFDESELDWIANKMREATELMQMEKSGGLNEEQAKQKKEAEDTLAAAQAKLADAEAKAKAGLRFMTPQEKAERIKQATDDKASATQELKDAAENTKNVQAEVAKAEAEAATADKLAKNPPKDIDVNDRQAYSDQKKEEAKQARENAGEARKRLTEALNQQKEVQARVDAIARRITNPEVPATPDERTEVNEQNKQAVMSAREEVNSAQQNLNSFKEQEAGAKKQMDEMRAKVPADNVALVKKYIPLLDNALNARVTPK